MREILKSHQQSSSLETNQLPADNQLTIRSMARRLASPKLDLETGDEVRQTALNLASRFNHKEICLLLMEQGAKVMTVDKDGWTPMLNAARNGNLELVVAFLERKARVDDKDIGGFTPLMWAVYRNHLPVVKCLIQHGADPNAKCKVHFIEIKGDFFDF